MTKKIPRERDAVTKVVHERQIVCTCLDCHEEWDNTGAAFAHTLHRRHTVAVDYFANFEFQPKEGA